MTLYRYCTATLSDSSSEGCSSPAGSLKVVLNEGFPQHRNPFDKGRLVIQFSVSGLQLVGLSVAFVCYRWLMSTAHGLGLLWFKV